MTVRVTITDLVDGYTETRDAVDGDYFIVTTQPCYVSGTQVYPKKGTHVITVKGHAPQALEPLAATDDEGEGLE